MLPGGSAGDPTFGAPPGPAGARDAGLQLGGHGGGLDAPSAGSHVSPPFPSGVSPASTRSRACPDLWGQVVGAGEPPARPTPPPAPRPPRCFRPVLAHVQLLWELMLLGEPLLVLAPSPAVSSEMVLALTRLAGRPAGGRGPGPAPRAHCPEGPHSRSCLQPLKFCCDYRPYFTIHDSEFKEFTTRTQAP